MVSSGWSVEVRRRSVDVYDRLAGDVLLDDRHESVSSKFNDAKLLGIPYRIVVSQDTLADDTVEIHSRRSGETWRVPIDEVARIGVEEQS